MAIVYLLNNLKNGKSYVGKTKFTLKRRWVWHLNSVKRGSRYALHHAIRKYGAEAFVMKVLAEYATEEAALAGEREWILSLNTIGPRGYNMCRGGRGALGYRHSDSAKARMRDIALSKGRRPSPLAVQRSRDVRSAGLSAPAKARMSASQQNRRTDNPVTDAFRETIRRLKTGKKIGSPNMSDESKESRKESMRAAWVVRKANGGGDKSYVDDVFREKMSRISRRNRLTSPKFIAKASKPVCQDCGVAQTPANTMACARRQTGLDRRCKPCNRTYFNNWRANRAAQEAPMNKDSL